MLLGVGFSGSIGGVDVIGFGFSWRDRGSLFEGFRGLGFRISACGSSHEPLQLALGFEILLWGPLMFVVLVGFGVWGRFQL